MGQALIERAICMLNSCLLMSRVGKPRYYFLAAWCSRMGGKKGREIRAGSIFPSPTRGRREIEAAAAN